MAEPIAIVGVACRLPGGIDSPASFWEFLMNGGDGITEIPADRWNREAYYSSERAHAGKVISRKGGFVEGFDLFDPVFFGISETEAPYIDPQQRLLLEVTWEAFERAGLVMEHYRSQLVGVFIGCFTNDYLHLQFADPYDFGAYTATGTMGTMVAARISHTFDFRGPCMTIDTACSSSLHSVHLACESLRAMDSDIAVAGGSQLILIPEFNIAETKAGFLSDASQCRMFDAQARGYVRSEGIGVVVLKRLRDAVAAGDPIQAIILGSAINQDGRTPSIAQPNLEAQKEVMRRACARAGISPAAVHYVEAHGTGTLAGDRVEAEAIGKVFRADPACFSELLVGSVKSNIGHTEAAAGICGLIKAALCVKHGVVPPNLHFETPNPSIKLEDLRIQVPLTATPLSGKPVVACVNSFGFGGSNAAVIIRSAKELECPLPAPPAHKMFLFPVSARSACALRDSAQRMREWLQPLTEERREDLCHTAGVRRTHHRYRRAFVFSDIDSLRHQLTSLAIEKGQTECGNDLLAHKDTSKGTVWVFSGAGNQRFQTGLQLFQQEPVFRDVVERCDEIYRGLAGFSLIDVMRAGSSHEYIYEAWLSHPVTLSIQLGLASLFRKWGEEPAAILGHSLGETGAFHAAGVYDLEHTLELVFHRCECLKPLHGSGGLLAVAAGEQRCRTVLGEDGTDLAIAAINGPAAITLSAYGASLDAARERLDRAGIRYQVLAELFACHHRYAALELAAASLEGRIRGLQASAPRTPLFSTVTGTAVELAPTPSYWATQLVEQVKLHQVVSMLAKLGFQRYLEIGPHPAVSGFLAATLRKKHGRVFATLRPGRDEKLSLLSSLGGLYEAGHSVDWHALYPSGDTLELPTYPWQRRRYWREPEPSVHHRTRVAASHLLGERVTDRPKVWRAEVSVERFPFLLDHRVAGESLFPAAGYIDMALCAGKEHFAGYPFIIEDLNLLKVVPLNQDSAFFTEFRLDEVENSFAIYVTPSLTVRSARRVADGKLRSLPPRGSLPPELPAFDTSEDGFDGTRLYDRFAHLGYDYRGSFRGIRRAWVNGDEALCEVELPGGSDTTGHAFHPAALDAAFQSLLCIRAVGEGQDKHDSRVLDVPDRIGSIRIHGVSDGRALVWARVRDTEVGSSGDVYIFDGSWHLLAHISEFRTRRVERSSNSKAVLDLDRCVYHTEWCPDQSQGALISGPARSEKDGAWLILSDGDIGDRLARRLAELGISSVVICSWRFPKVTPTMRPYFAEVLNQLSSMAVVIHLGNLEISNSTADVFPGSSECCCGSLLTVAQTLFRHNGDAKLWVITRGAHHLKASDPPADPFQASAWGLARTIGQREMPKLWGGLIDLSHQCLPAEIDAAASSILLHDGEDQVAIRGRERSVLRLCKTPPAVIPQAPKIVFRPDVAYMITGAFGALGGQVARWMVARGARRLILPDHRDQPRRCAALVADLESMGVVVELVALDLSESARVAEYCALRQREQKPPIRGVIYCAGRSHDQLVVKTDCAVFHEVFRTKAAGAWTLHQAFRHAPLEHFVMFSSVASILPNPGMGAYAAANQFLDTLADHRQSLGLPGLSIAWGPWEIGMTERGSIKTYLDQEGVHCFTISQAMQLLENVWHSEYPNPTVLAIDWGRALARGKAGLPILKHLEEESAPHTASDRSSDAAEPRSGRPVVSTGKHLRNLIEELVLARHQLDIDMPLVDQGLDSLSATVLSEKLYRDFGLRVEANAFAQGLNLATLESLVSASQSR